MGKRLSYFDELLTQAQAARAKAEEYEKLEREWSDKADALEAEAASLVVPFKLGDIIEYETKFGWRNEKTVKRRMLVDRLSVSGQWIEASGKSVTKDTVITWRRRNTLRFPGDTFIRIIKSAQEITNERTD